MALYPLLCLLVFVVFSTVQGSSEEAQCREPFGKLYYEDETYDRPCQRLASALSRFIAWLPELVTVMEGPGEMVELMFDLDQSLGIDPTDEDEVTEFVCRLEGVESVDEVIEKLNLLETKKDDEWFLHLWEDMIRDTYHTLQLVFAPIDGLHGFLTGSEIMLTLKDGLRLLTGKGEGELPDAGEVSRVLNVDNLSDLLATAEDIYGSGYLIHFLMLPYNDALVGVDHKVLAQAILEKDIACRLGVSYAIEARFNMQFSSLTRVPTSPDVVQISIDFYIAADQMGLFNLRV